MKFTGVTDPEIQAQLGVCEVCGAPATQVARDVDWVPIPGSINSAIEDNGVRRRCDEHEWKGGR